MARILISPLSWGLGHATRDVPVIDEFLSQGHDLVFASGGRVHNFLKKRYPQCKHIYFPDYPGNFGKGNSFFFNMTLQLPKFVWHIFLEGRRARKIIEKEKIDLVFSDQRYNVRHPKVPSFLYAHQLRFFGPKNMNWITKVLEWFNSKMYNQFTQIIVPDFKDIQKSLSGRLSHKLKFFNEKKIYYAGPLADAQDDKKATKKKDIDYFISVSGPEPQRTVFEELVLTQARELKGKIVIALGKPEVDMKVKQGNMTIYSFLDRKKQQSMMKKSNMIISRSGYTTVMELLQIKRKALLVPTPNQTEQEYLSLVYAKRGWFHSIPQDKLNLAQQVEYASSFSGFPMRFDVKKAAKKLYDDVFSRYL